MRNSAIICGAVAVCLAGCSKQPSVTAENASMAEVAAKAQAAARIEPGEWDAKMEILSLDMPGMNNPQAKAIMESAVKTAQQQAFSYCVTPEEASKPSTSLFASKDNGDCRYDNFDMSNGAITAAMTCTPKNGGSIKTSMNGTYSPTGYDMTMNMTMSNPAMPGGMTLKARTTGARKGECPAT